MIGQNKKVNDYFFFNHIKIKKNSNFFGSLEFGGLSNYWGLQIDKNIRQDISHLTKKTQKKIIKSFTEIFKRHNLLGKVDKDEKNYFNESIFFNDEFAKRNKNLILEEPILAYQ